MGAAGWAAANNASVVQVFLGHCVIGVRLELERFAEQVFCDEFTKSRNPSTAFCPVGF